MIKEGYDVVREIYLMEKLDQVQKDTPICGREREREREE